MPTSGYLERGTQQPLSASLELQLREALEREAATAEILRVIASSPAGFGPIFAAIAERSNKLVNGLSTAVFHLIDGTLHLAAFTRRSEVADATLVNLFPLKLSDIYWYERTIREVRPVQIEDCESDALQIVKPDTVIRWHRDGFRAYGAGNRHPGAVGQEPQLRFVSLFAR